MSAEWTKEALQDPWVTRVDPSALPSTKKTQGRSTQLPFVSFSYLSRWSVLAFKKLKHNFRSKKLSIYIFINTLVNIIRGSKNQ